MTEQEQRIAIAEACPTVFKHDGRIVYWHTCHQKAHEAVDPINDLNAIREAVQTLPSTRRGYYNAELFQITTGRNLSSAIKEPDFIFQALNATAAQCAEAFLKITGK